MSSHSYTVVFEVSVTADSAKQAAAYALADLRDESLGGPWYADVKRDGSTKSRKVTVPA